MAAAAVRSAPAPVLGGSPRSSLRGPGRHAQAWLTADEEAAAVAGLRQAAPARSDLLAECAGTAQCHTQVLGWTSDHPFALQKVRLGEISLRGVTLVPGG